MKARHGFTLLELLIGAVLIAVVAGVVASAFAAGFRVWRRVAAPGAGEAILACEQIGKDLHNTVPVRLAQFKGDAVRVEIPSLVALPVPKGGDRTVPAVIRYEFNEGAHSLDRIIHSYPLPDPEQERRETVMEGVEVLRFSYSAHPQEGPGPGAWERDWTGRTNAPDAVKVELRFRIGEALCERERTILLPCR